MTSSAESVMDPLPHLEDGHRCHRREAGGGRRRETRGASRMSGAILVAATVAALLAAQALASSPKAPKGSPAAAEDGSAGPGRGGAPASADAAKKAPPKKKSRCGRPCGNGYCDESAAECVCHQGWRGEHCHLCGGKIRMNGTSGWLADAVGNYTVDSKCTWLIEAPPPYRHEPRVPRIRLHLKDFATECGWDHLYVFDGDSVFSDLRAVFSGMVLQDRYRVHRVPELVGHSGFMLLHFYSDVAYNMTGFNITFSVDECPSEHHELTCSGHGSCNKTTGR